MTSSGLMRWIVAISLRFRWLVLFAAIALLVAGAAEIRSAQVDVFPEFAPPRVEIQTLATGNSSAQVEELITIPLEEQLNGIEGLQELRSKSIADLSAIELIFKRGTNEVRARQLVQERMAAITPSLPTFAAPPFMMPAVSAASRVMKIGLTSDKVSPIELSTIAYWKIRQRLLRVPGVANVAIWGERLQQEHVQVDPKKLARNGVTVDEVMNATGDSLDSGLLRFSDGSFIGKGGFVETGGQRLNVRNKVGIDSAADLGKVVLERRDGTRLRVSDVATLKEEHQPLGGDAVVNGGPGLLLVVQKYPGANTLKLTKGLDDAIAQMRPGLPDINIDATIFRPASFIDSAVHNLTTTLLLGCLLVVLILGAFLFEWRTAMISLIAIPLSLIAAIVVLDLNGTTINVMLLAGLVVSVGVVVDDAIIGAENITRRLRQHRASGSDRSTARVILDATLEVRSSITYATLIILVAVVPVYLLSGLSGSFFKPLVLAYGLAVLVSMLVALTITPALCFILLRNAPLKRQSPMLGALKRGYGAILSRVVRTPRPALVLAATLVLAGVLVAPTLGSSLFPTFKERDFLLHWINKPGTSQPEQARIVQRGCADLDKVPGVRNCGSHIGQAFLAEETEGVNFGENWISISPNADYDKTIAAVQKTADSYPGIFRNVQTYLRERISESLTGTSNAVDVKIFGPDLDVIGEKAKEVAAAIRKVPGVVDAHSELHENVPHIQVEVKLPQARRYGLKPGDIRRQSGTLLATEEVGDIFRGGRAYDVHVSSIPSVRGSVDDVRNLQLDTPGGGHVRLRDVATIKVAGTPNTIERQSESRLIQVGANVSGRSLSAVVDDVKARLAKVRFAQGYHAEVAGEATELNSAQSNLGLYGLAAIIIIFLLLQAVFASARLALLTFLTLPMALVGGVLAAKLTGGELSLGSLVGFLTVFGICARNGILMVSHFQHLEREEGEAFGPALVLRGASERLAPILMTASATALALVPLVIAGPISGHEIEYPMAVVILGGLVTSTLLNLFVMPSLYLRFGRSRGFAFNRRLAHAGAAAVLLLVAALALGACGGSDEIAAGKAAKAASPATDRDLPRATFSDPTTIDNRWHPVAPGMQYIFEGRANRGGGARPHRVVFTVTDLTKKIDGVQTRVLWDRDINAGKLLEGELTFFAQDDAGNVWNFGEYPEQYDQRGRFDGAPDTWISGIARAHAGILMRADPRPGTSSYLQGNAPTIGFGDTAKVQKLGQRTCVPRGCYDNVLVIDETNPLEPGNGHQLKYYAAGVGNVQVEPRGGKEHEVLVLVKVRKLGDRELARVRREALVLDRRGFRTRKEVYGRTQPARLPG
ncbi:MAG TPA: efflux RND transporter permease subunit [Solirubrobacteraceae bacterium]